jgi:hypothetical protein
MASTPATQLDRTTVVLVLLAIFHVSHALPVSTLEMEQNYQLDNSWTITSHPKSLSIRSVGEVNRDVKVN